MKIIIKLTKKELHQNITVHIQGVPFELTIASQLQKSSLRKKSLKSEKYSNKKREKALVKKLIMGFQPKPNQHNNQPQNCRHDQDVYSDLLN